VHLTRREFLAGAAAGVAGLTLEPAAFAEGLVTPARGAVPLRALGKTGVKVSAVGLGGFHLGLDSLTDQDAVRLVRTAVDEGITFVENAREYIGGRCEERLGKALRDGYRDKVFLTAKNCGHMRTKADCMTSLEESLRALQTDRVDLMLFHEVIYDNDPDWIFERGGLAAAVEARKQGKVRFIGFSGHKHPDIHLDMLRRDFEWDAVMMPLGVMDARFRSFAQQVLPALSKRQIGSITIKNSGGFMSPMLWENKLTAAECLRYTLSLPISTIALGIESLKQLADNLAVARNFVPMSATEHKALFDRIAAVAADGRYEIYKTTQNFDGAAGKVAHGFQH